MHDSVCIILYILYLFIGSHVNMQTTAAIAKEYLNGVNSPTAESIDGKSSHAVRPKDQLMYLAQLLGFRVQFSDFPKVILA